jgi:alpha-N-arabinofuranosidase
MNRTANFSIDPAEPLGRIHPNLYGHFAEHLGRCIYGGIWAGEESPIPNTHGFRNDIIAALRRLKPSVLRWPGGCFADDYHWQDGIGPRLERPRRINIHWGEVIETNQVGTQEFVRFCRLIGAEPYFSGNVGSGTVRELRDWVEYCNFPGDSSWAKKRAADGSPNPLNITYWGVGNESWGCGGHFSPEDYCTEFRRYASFMPEFGNELFLIACGPSGNDVEWTDRFFRKLHKDYRAFNNIQGFAAHYYCGTAGNATEYTDDQWYQLLEKGLKIEELVIQQRAAMDAWDPARKIGLVVDEWGTWHPVEKGSNPVFLFQQNTMRDAIVAANTLDIFNCHADKVVMANIAQMVNVLQAMILTEGEKMLVTPTGYVYEMYAPHQGALSLQAHIETEEVTFQRTSDQESRIPIATGSASIRGKRLYLTMTNSHAQDALEMKVNLLGGATIATVSGRILSGEIHAHNTFEAPETVKPTQLEVGFRGSQIRLTLPPACVAAVELTLD